MTTLLRDLPDEFFYCLRGAYGHEWEALAVPRKTEWGQPLDSLCVRCTKVRHDVFDINGGLSYRSYDPPKGYPSDIEPHTTGDVRLELVRRERAKARSRGLRVVNGGRA